MLVEAWLQRAAAARPERVALETATERLTYAELLARARAGRQALAGAGVAPGERVGIALAPGMPFALALHACLLHGAVAVPIDLRLPPGEQALIREGCALTLDRPLERAEPDPNPAGAYRHELEAPALVIHSSGTTGAPKPIELTYGNLLWSALGSAVALGLDPGERWLCTLPLTHVGGLSILIRSAIYGTTAVLHEGFDAERARHALAEGQVTLVSLVATTLKRLLEAGLREPPALRCALVGGGAVPQALVREANRAGIRVAKTYGLTEAASQVSTQPLALLESSDSGQELGGDGAPPLFCTRVLIAPDGEILVAGPTVAPRALAADGWLHTGDEGSIDARGHLRMSARRSEMIVTGGENVAPVEVESAIESHMGVREAAVIGRADPEWGEAVTAIVVVAPDGQVEVEKLRAHCVRRLAPYKVPKQFILTYVPLARTPSGKLRRRELARRFGVPSGE